MKQKIISAKYIMPIPGTVLENHYVTVVNGRITGISKFHTMKTAGTQNEFIHLGNSVIMPGFVNSHIHLELCSENLDATRACDYFEMLDKISKQRKFNVNNPFALKHNILFALEQLIKGGTTCIGNFTSTPETSTKILEKNLTAVEYVETRNLFAERNEDIFIKTEELRKEIKEKASKFLEKSVTPVKFGTGIALRSMFTSNVEFIELIYDLFTKENLRFATHISEHPDENRLFQLGDGSLFDYLDKRYNLSKYSFPPAASSVQLMSSLLEEFDKTALNLTPMVVHSNFIDATDVMHLMDMKSSVVFCPSSYETFVNSEIRKYPFKMLVDKLIPVALGTDTTLAGTNLSMLDEIRLLAQNYPELLVTDILRMATVNGAKALNLSDSAGILAEGRNADMIAIEIPPHTKQEDVPTEIIYGYGDVKMTMLKGEIEFQKL